jgi:hypothetical protein
MKMGTIKVIRCQHLEEGKMLHAEIDDIPIGDDYRLELCEICERVLRAWIIETILQDAIRAGMVTALRR